MSFRAWGRASGELWVWVLVLGTAPLCRRSCADAVSVATASNVATNVSLEFRNPFLPHILGIPILYTETHDLALGRSEAWRRGLSTTSPRVLIVRLVRQPIPFLLADLLV